MKISTKLYNSLPYIAISYPTVTFKDLEHFLAQDGIQLSRQDPEEFTHNYITDANYINLVVNQIQQRKTISKLIDDRNLTRFSYVHHNSTNSGQVESGCFVYPGAVIYYGAVIKKDTIIHASSAIGHNVTLGTGTYISGGVLIGGSSTLGEFNRCMLGAIIHDNINICDDVIVGANTVIRKDIDVPGTYSDVSKITKQL